MEQPPILDNTQLLKHMNAPYLSHKETVHFLRTHGRLLFLLRGLPGSGKGIVATELKRLYPDSRTYCADMFFSSPMAPERSHDTMRESHVLCVRKIEGFMVENVPVVINRNTNVRVWEIAVYLVLAAKYGYTAILIDMPRYVTNDPQVLALTNNKGLDWMYMSNRLNNWEDVYPFATGWSPRPGDAAWLLRRFRQIRKALKRDGAVRSLQDVANDKVFPFFFARVSAFGRNWDSREYCVSQKVRQACGRSDTLRVFGFAVSQGFVFAMALLSKAQASLTTGARGEPARNVVAATWASSGLWEQACVVGLANHAPDNARGNEQHILCQVGDRVTLADVDLSRVTFMPLGSTTGIYYSYDRAVAAGYALLSSNLPSWKASSGPKLRGGSASGFDVFGSTDATNGGCLLVDNATAQLEVVFTGYYLPYATAKSWNTWSKMQGMLGRPLPCGYRSSLSVPIAGTKRPHLEDTEKPGKPGIHCRTPSNSKAPLTVSAEVPPPKRVRGRQDLAIATSAQKKLKSTPELSKRVKRRKPESAPATPELSETSTSAASPGRGILRPRRTAQPNSTLSKSRDPTTTRQASTRTDRGTHRSSSEGRKTRVAKRARKTSPARGARAGKAPRRRASDEVSPPTKRLRETPARRCKATREAAGIGNNGKRNAGRRRVRGKAPK